MATSRIRRLGQGRKDVKVNRKREMRLKWRMKTAVFEPCSRRRVRRTNIRPEDESSNASAAGPFPHPELRTWLHVRTCRQSKHRILSGTKHRLPRYFTQQLHQFSGGSGLFLCYHRHAGGRPGGDNPNVYRTSPPLSLFQHTEEPRQQEESMANGRLVRRSGLVWESL